MHSESVNAGQPVLEGRGWPDHMEMAQPTKEFNYQSIGHKRGGWLYSMDRNGQLKTAVQNKPTDNHDSLGLRDHTTFAWGRYDPHTQHASIASTTFSGLKEKHIKALASKWNIKKLHYFGEPTSLHPDLAPEFHGAHDAIDAYYEAAGYLPGKQLDERKAYDYRSPHHWVRNRNVPAGFIRAYQRDDGYLVAETARGWKLYEVEGRKRRLVAPMLRSSDWPKSLAFRWADDYTVYDVHEKIAPGWSGTVRAMIRKHPEINNPYSLSYSMWLKGFRSHYKPLGKDRRRSPKRHLKRAYSHFDD